MPGRLKDQVAIITGGTSGIGEGTAECFVEEGASVVIAGRSKDKGEAIAGRLGDRAAYYQADVTKEEDIVGMIEFTKNRFGRVDCLFNNAGAAASGFRVEEITGETFDYECKLLLGSIIFGVKHALPIMRAQGRGNFINNASIAGMGSGYGPHVYSAAKAGVIQLTRSLAMELAKDNIRVNAISPGVITTPIFGKVMGFDAKRIEDTLEDVGEVFGSHAHMGRGGLPREVGEAAVYLASDGSSYITGHNLVVDGGMTMGLTIEQIGERIAQASKLGA